MNLVRDVVDINGLFYCEYMSRENDFRAKDPNEYPQITPDGIRLNRNYCRILDPQKYNRNLGCKFHDNAYGIRGGGSSQDRKCADLKLLQHMLHENDPMAWPTYVTVRLFGWFFFNFTKNSLWRGQLSKKIKCS